MYGTRRSFECSVAEIRNACVLQFYGKICIFNEDFYKLQAKDFFLISDNFV